MCVYMCVCVLHKIAEIVLTRITVQFDDFADGPWMSHSFFFCSNLIILGQFVRDGEREREGDQCWTRERSREQRSSRGCVKRGCE